MLHVSITSFTYSNDISNSPILENLDFSVAQGDHLAILGESGCGKSTLLHLIYGLLDLYHGSISFQGSDLFGPSRNLVPGHRIMKLVAQELELTPFISVAENVADHLSRLDASKDEQKVEEVLSVVDLLPFKNHKLKTLSGGQKQRVALARALANEPELLLLDEPFSSIDTFRKNHLRRHLYAYLKDKNISCITATHDAVEALSFSDQLLVLKEGKALQYGAPPEVYKAATTAYEKSFYGEVSTVPAGILSKEERHVLPHELKISEAETALKAVVTSSFYRGQDYLIACRTNSDSYFVAHSVKLAIGSFCYVALA